jgi:ELWxxDGT repeat protein
MVQDLLPGFASSYPAALAAGAGNLFFSCTDNSHSPGRELWISDGTEDGTELFLDLNPSTSSNPYDFTFLGSRMLFWADDGTGLKLWAVTLNGTPQIDSLELTPNPVALNEPMIAQLIVMDPDAGQILDIEWDWGDGNAVMTSHIASSGLDTVSSSHDYNEPGVYTVNVTVTDEYGESVNLEFQYAVCYDPEGGFVTGGGWIDSPAGAYTPDPAMTGKASFGFVSKYKKGTTVPTGQTTFKFHAADLNFNSTDYQWLVVAGKKAQFKGWGAINDAGDYGFMLTAIDGDLSDPAEPDRFRIKIWDRLTDELIYDNQLDAPEDAEPTTGLGGGSIVIHKN